MTMNLVPELQCVRAKEDADLGLMQGIQTAFRKEADTYLLPEPLQNKLKKKSGSNLNFKA